MLQSPLHDSDKIPINNATFNSLLSRDHPSACTEEDLHTVFRIDELSVDTSHVFISVVRRLPPPSTTARSFVHFWDMNIREIIGFLVPAGKMIRNDNLHMVTGDPRPGFGFILKGKCIFRGEEKGPGSGGNPAVELIDKVDWVYDPAPYILGAQLFCSVTSSSEWFS